MLLKKYVYRFFSSGSQGNEKGGRASTARLGLTYSAVNNAEAKNFMSRYKLKNKASE